MLLIKTLSLMLFSAIFTALLFYSNKIEAQPSVTKPILPAGRFITVNQAALYTRQFQKLRTDNKYPTAEKFNKALIYKLLQKNGATDLRIYLGRDNQGLVRLVLVAVDQNGHDITGRSYQKSALPKIRKALNLTRISKNNLFC